MINIQLAHRLCIQSLRLEFRSLPYNLDSNSSLTAVCVAAFAPPIIHLFNTHNAKYIREAVHVNNSVQRSSAAFLFLLWGNILQVCREYEERLRRMPAVPRFSCCRVFNETPMRFPCSVTASIVCWQCELLDCWWCVFVLVSYICICACVRYLYRSSVCVCVRYLYCSCVSGATASSQTGSVPYNTDHLYVRVLGQGHRLSFFSVT